MLIIGVSALELIEVKCIDDLFLRASLSDYSSFIFEF